MQATQIGLARLGIARECAMVRQLRTVVASVEGMLPSTVVVSAVVGIPTTTAPSVIAMVYVEVVL